MKARTKSRLMKGSGVATALAMMAVTFVGNWEGLRLYAYQDVIDVWTACYGETRGIKPGMKFTREQCDIMFIGSLTEHEQGMRSCLAQPDAIPPKTYVAFVSFTYNVGIGAFCKSTLRKKANAGDLRGACNELPRWVNAGGKRIRGLVNRRRDEQRLCLEGLAA